VALRRRGAISITLQKPLWLLFLTLTSEKADYLRDYNSLDLLVSN